jgi:multidrug transporter EmrE-like cation transporter
MSTFWTENAYLILAVLLASCSQIVLKALLNGMEPSGFNWSFVRGIFSYGRVFRMLLALAMLMAAFVFWIMSLGRLNISYAYAFACSSALLVNFFSVMFLNEEVSVRMWLGTVFIVLGTILLGSSR